MAFLDCPLVYFLIIVEIKRVCSYLLQFLQWIFLISLLTIANYNLVKYLILCTWMFYDTQTNNMIKVDSHYQNKAVSALRGIKHVTKNPSNK